MYDFTLVFAGVCGLIGYIPLLISELILKKGRYNILRYSIILLVCIFAGATIGYLTGVLGPIYLTPDANLGPLLGIFITGPAGAVLGVLLFWGILFWKRKST